MENKLELVKEFLEDSVAEMNEYIESDDYDDLDTHDCVIALEAYERVLRHVNELLGE